MRLRFVSVVLMLILCGISFPAAITGCQAITVADTYILNNSISGAPFYEPYRSGSACIDIYSSDVVIDCAGHSITNNETGITFGILLQSINNVTLRNCNISNYTFGAYIYNSSFNSFSYNNITPEIPTSSYGFYSFEGNYSNYTSNNVIFTPGYYGDGIGLYWGSSANRVENNTFISPGGLSGAYGIDMNQEDIGDGFFNNTIINVQHGIMAVGNYSSFINNTIINSSDIAIYLWEVHHSLFESNFINKSQHGIYVTAESSNDSFINNTALNSIMYGFNADTNAYNLTLINNTLQESGWADFYMTTGSDANCQNNNIRNNTGSGNRPIIYPNPNEVWSNVDASEVFLCKADNAILSNITIWGSYTLNNNGFYMVRTNNASISNMNSSNGFYGFYLYLDNGSRFTNCSTASDANPGYFTVYGTNGTAFTNISENVSSNGYNGFYLSSSHNNNLSSISIVNTSAINANGILIYSDSSGNILRDSLVLMSGGDGVQIGNSNNNSLINNTINNTNNGIDMWGSNNNSFTNNSLYNVSSQSFGLSGSNNNYFMGNDANTTQWGFYLTGSSNSTFINNSVYNASYYGFFADETSNNHTVINNTLLESGYYDFFLNVNGNEDCQNNNISNNTGSGYRPIIYPNPNEAWSNIDVSEVFICKADNAILSNITVRGSSSIRNNGVYIMRTSNALVRNVTSTNGHDGFYIYGCSGLNVTGSSSTGSWNQNYFEIRNTNGSSFSGNKIIPAANNIAAFFLSGSSRNNFTSNNITNGSAASCYGFSLAPDSSNNTIARNTIILNGGTAFYLYGSETNDSFINNTVNNTQYVASLSSTSGHSFIGNNASNISNTAYDTTNSNNDIFIGNSVISSLAAFFLRSSNNNTLAGNNVSNCSQYCIYLQSCSNNTLSNDSASISQNAIYLLQSNNTSLINEHYFNCTKEFMFDALPSNALLLNMSNVIFDNPAGNLTNYTNISLNGNIAANASFTMGWMAQPAAPPAGFKSFAGKHINISNSTAQSVTIDSISWVWLDSELQPGDDEASFVLYEYNSSGWTQLNNTPNTTGNTLSLSNFVPGSDYAILEYTCTAPTNDYLVNASAIFCSGTYNINDSGAAGVIIANANNINITCAGTVLVGNGSGSGIYSAGKTGLNISGCTLANYSYGINVNNPAGSGSNRLLNNTVANTTSYGIYLNYPDYDVIANNAISNATGAGIYSANPSGNSFLGFATIANNTVNGPAGGSSIYIYDDCGSANTHNDNNSISNNTVGNDTNGILMYAYCPMGNWGYLSNNTVSNNTCRNASNACYDLLSTNVGSMIQTTNLFANNTASNATYGIYLSTPGTMYGNNFTGNALYNISSYGVYFATSNTYYNDFSNTNTLDGLTFYHYYNWQNTALSGFFANATLNKSYNATNLGLFDCVQCRNVSLSGASLAGDSEYGVFLWQNYNVTIYNSTLANSVTNVYLYNDNASTITNNNISAGTYGVWSDASLKGPTISSNLVSGTSSYGIYIRFPWYETVANNTVLNTGTAGIYSTNPSGNAFKGFATIANNTVNGPAGGSSIYIYDDCGSANTHNDNNSISNNSVGNDTNGILMYAYCPMGNWGYLSNNTVSNNTCRNASNACYDLLSTNVGSMIQTSNLFANNTASNATYGILLSTPGTMSGNNFTNNALYNISSYGVYFNTTNTYYNDFSNANTLDGFTFYHYYNWRNTAFSGINTNATLNKSMNATNLGLFTCVQCSNLTLSASSLAGDSEYGAFLWQCYNVTIANSTIAGSPTNVYLYNDNISTIISNNVSGGNYGIWSDAPKVGPRILSNTVANTSSYGIYVRFPWYEVIANNSVSNTTGAGIYSANPSGNSVLGFATIANNTVNGPAGGSSIYLFDDAGSAGTSNSNNSITSNTVGNSTNGILLYAVSYNGNWGYMSNNTVANNTCRNASNACYDLLATNVGAMTQNNNLFVNNTASNATYGVLLSTPGTMTGNNFSNNQLNASSYALYFGSSNPANTILTNNTLENDVNGNFIYNPGASASYSNITFVRGMGSVNFRQSGISLAKSVNSSNTVIDSDIASINSTALPEFAIPANVTSYTPQCPETIFWKSGFPATSALILSGGSVCTAPQCTRISCNGNLSIFSVANFSGYTANTTASANISALKLTQTTAQPSPGGIVQFNITINNTGNLALNPVSAIDALPSGLEYLAASQSPSSVIGQTVSWNNLGTLAPGSSLVIYLNASVDEDAVSQSNPVVNLTNNVNVSALDPYSSTVNATSAANVTVYYANVSVLKLLQTAVQPSPGGLVQFNMTVTNTGNVTLNPTQLKDVLPSGLTYSASSPAGTLSGQNVTWSVSLAPGASGIYYLNATVDPGTVNASTPIRNLTNSFTALGVPPDGDNVSAASSANVTVYYANVSVLKLLQTAVQPSPGGLVQFNMTVTNTGNVTLNPINLTDTLPAGLTFISASPANTSAGPFWSISLAPGNSAVFYLNATVNPGVVNSTIPVLNLTNCISALGVPPDGSNVNSNSCANVTVYYANVSVIKLLQTALQPSPGGIVQFNMTLTNTGNVSLNGTLTDSLPISLAFTSASPANLSAGPTWSFTNLAPGASNIYYLNSTVDAGTVNASSPIRNLTNTISAMAKPLDGDNVSATSAANVTVYYANVSVIKLLQTALQPSPGGIVQFNMTVTNTGNVSLNPLPMTDVLPAGITFASASVAPSSQVGQTLTWNNMGPLNPGSSAVVYLNATVNAGIVNSTVPLLNLTNGVNVTGVPPDGTNVLASSDANVTIYYANVSVIKLSQTSLQPSPGGLVQFNVTLTNTGNVSLNGTVGDVLPIGLTFVSASPANTTVGPGWSFTILAPGASTIYYLNATVNTGVVNASTPIRNLTNTITATAMPPDGTNVSAASSANVTVYYANVSVLKLLQTAVQPSPGGLVQFNMTVTNTGNVTLNPTQLKDVLPSGLTYSASSPAGTLSGQNVTWSISLAPGASGIYYLNATVDPGTVNASTPIRNLTNSFTALGVPPDGDNVSAASSANVTVYYANVSVLKLLQTAVQPSPGGLVQFNMTLTNTGNVSLNPLPMTDVLPAGLTFASASIAPSSQVGQTLTWNNMGPLNPGSSAVVYLNATVNAGTVNASTPILNLTNTVNVTGAPPDGTNVSASSSANVTVYYANVSVIKLLQTAVQPSPGGIVQFNMTVTNTGNVTLNPLRMTDQLPAGLSYYSASPAPSSLIIRTVDWANIGPLAPGSSAVIYVNATVDAGVVNASVQSANLTNRVNVTGIPPDGSPVFSIATANTSVFYANISVIKVDITPVMVSPGGIVQWRMNVSNPGLVALDPVYVIDTLPASFAYSASSIAPSSISSDNRTIRWANIGPLAPGAYAQIYLNSTVSPSAANGTYLNAVNVTGSPPDGDNVTDSDTALVGIFAPALNVVKTVNQSNASINDNVTFRINVTNTGSAPLNITIVDVLPANVSFHGSDVPPTSIIGRTVIWAGFATIVPGASVAITYNASADINGTFINNVNATGSPSNGANITDSSSAYFTTLSAPPESNNPSHGHPLKPTDLSVSTSCDGNTVAVMSGTSPVTQADVRIEGDPAGSTDTQGNFSFQGCGRQVIVHISKDGYMPAFRTVDEVDCGICKGCKVDSDCPDSYKCDSGSCSPVSCFCGMAKSHQCVAFQCCSDSDCKQSEACQDHACKAKEICQAPGCCTSDPQCQSDQSCLIPGNETKGSCKDISGCGTAADHRLIPYQCGTEPGCPSCGEGQSCMDHECVSHALTGPQEGFVGENAVINASEGIGPCKSCDLVITDPSGKRFTGITGQDGGFTLPLSMNGTYRISLLKGGIELKTIKVNALPKSSGTEPQKPTELIPAGYLPCLVLGALAILVLLVLWMRRKKQS